MKTVVLLEYEEKQVHVVSTECVNGLTPKYASDYNRLRVDSFNICKI